MGDIFRNAVQTTTGKDPVFTESIEIKENDVVIEQDIVSTDGKITDVITTITKPTGTLETIDDIVSTIQSDIKKEITNPIVRPATVVPDIPSKTKVTTVLNEDLSPQIVIESDDSGSTETIEDILRNAVQTTTGKDPVFTESVEIKETDVVIEQDIVSTDGKITDVVTTITKPTGTSETIDDIVQTIQSDIKKEITNPTVRPAAVVPNSPSKTKVTTVLNEDLSPQIVIESDDF